MLASVIARTNGAKDVKLADFVLDYREKPKGNKAGETAMALGDFAGVRVRKLGQKGRK